MARLAPSPGRDTPLIAANYRIDNAPSPSASRDFETPPIVAPPQIERRHRLRAVHVNRAHESERAREKEKPAQAQQPEIEESAAKLVFTVNPRAEREESEELSRSDRGNVEWKGERKLERPSEGKDKGTAQK